MSTIAETGHAKNVANFKALSIQVMEMGTRYNPLSDRINSKALTKKVTAISLMMSNLTRIGSLADISINKRVEQFAQIAKLITRIGATLKMARVSPGTMDDATGFIAKLRGRRRGKVPETDTANAGSMATGETGKVPKTISVSQRSFDMQQEVFGQLLSLVTAQPGYQSNDAELNKAGLTNFLKELEAANTEAITVNANYNEALMVRNTELYDPANGLMSLVNEIKEYLKSLPGGKDNPDYKNAVRLQFRASY